MNIMYFHKINVPTEAPKPEWFKDVTKLKFRTIIVKRIIVKRVDSINTTNKYGQIVNTVRAVGSDSVNKENIKESILSEGILDGSMPQFVLESGDLLEGFTRQSVYEDIGQIYTVVAECQLKDGFTIEEAKDEVGLGLNNHPSSKKHSLADFKKRCLQFIDRQKNRNIEVSKDDCREWFNNISHSFTEKRVNDTIDSIFDDKVASATMSKFNNNTASKLAEKLSGEKKVNAYDNKTGASFEKSFMNSIDEYDLYGRCSPFVSYLKSTTSENAHAQRKKNKDKIDKVKRVLKERLLPQFRYHQDNGTLDEWDPWPFLGHLPQMIDKETDLIA